MNLPAIIKELHDHLEAVKVAIAGVERLAAGQRQGPGATTELGQGIERHATQARTRATAEDQGNALDGSDGFLDSADTRV